MVKFNWTKYKILIIVLLFLFPAVSFAGYFFIKKQQTLENDLKANDEFLTQQEESRGINQKNIEEVQDETEKKVNEKIEEVNTKSNVDVQNVVEKKEKKNKKEKDKGKDSEKEEVKEVEEKKENEKQEYSREECENQKKEVAKEADEFYLNWHEDMLEAKKEVGECYEENSVAICDKQMSDFNVEWQEKVNNKMKKLQEDLTKCEPGDRLISPYCETSVPSNY